MNRKIAVLQIIDSFDIGGAERVSINIANALSQNENFKSFICATRKTGKLESLIDENVEKLILNKKSTFDLKSINRLIKFIKDNKIDILHAHSSSFFIAVIVKLFTKVKIIWHDHNGNRLKIKGKQNKVVSLLSIFFDFVIVVNNELKIWANQNLKLDNNKIVYIQNFPELVKSKTIPSLPGDSEKRIVSLANLRWQKDHLTLLKAFCFVFKEYPDYHLLLVGDDKDDEYSQSLKKFIQKNRLSQNVHILGSRIDSADILINSSIAVISSKSEGLPVSLLEYGLAKLSVISTDVGECSKVLSDGNFGIIVPKENEKLLGQAMLNVIEDKSLRDNFSESFNSHVINNYSKDIVINKLTKTYKKLLND